MRNLILFVTKKLPFHEIGAGRDHGATVQVEVVIHQKVKLVPVQGGMFCISYILYILVFIFFEVVIHHKVKLVRVQGGLFCIFDTQGGSFTRFYPTKPTAPKNNPKDILKTTSGWPLVFFLPVQYWTVGGDSEKHPYIIIYIQYMYVCICIFWNFYQYICYW